MKVKTKIMVFLVNVLVLGIALPGCGKISVLPKEVQIELGEEVPSNVSDYIYIEPHMLETIQSNTELDVSGIDSMTAGEYEAKIYYRGDVIISKVSVSDTTPPEILLKDTKFSAGDIVSANDLAEVTDFSDVTFNILYRYPDGEELPVDLMHLVSGKMIELKAVDEYGNETIVKTVPITYELLCQEEKSDKNTREYKDFFSLCDADLEYIDDVAYEELKEILGQVEWYPEFEAGEKEELELCLQKYKELLLMEREYVTPNGQKATLDSLIARQINEHDGSYFYYDMETNFYYVYDFDGDGAQELCVEVLAPVNIYVFKYDAQSDEVYLWYETGHWSQLGGTRTVFGGDGRPEYMDILNKYGEEESTYMNYCGFKYIIAIPCKNVEGEIIVSDEIYENSYQIINGDGRGYFYVTEEQFQELGQYMWDARAWAEKEIKKYQYTYDEIISNGN